MMIYLLFLIGAVSCGPATESYKDQYCTDPRTMRKHQAYTEWADAYSCTRHRCQPGGRNLAIYTVGCKRVEAPESAIECEEVVEDTNMQFPFCCTRLRCLVVVRGEVWTRVLGQPWETLPAAPWSHMYKMKKPPPQDGGFQPKPVEQGPVYELTDSESEGPKVRASNAATTLPPDCNDGQPRAAPQPDIVIALSTNSDPKDLKASDALNRHKRIHKDMQVLRADDRNRNSFEEEREQDKDSPRERDKNNVDAEGEMEDHLVASEKAKPQDIGSDERTFNYGSGYGVTQKTPPVGQHRQSWTEIPQNQWNEHDGTMEAEMNKENYPQEPPPEPHKDDKPSNLQVLVDAIGTRMRDIESVVQRMTDKVHNPGEDTEKRPLSEELSNKRYKGEKGNGKGKKPNSDDHYKRFSARNRGKYLHGAVTTTALPLFLEDTNMNGYFNDASNTLARRVGPKEPVETYMAPVETRRKSANEASEEKKRKKHQHKKKKGKHHKKHHNNNKKKFNRLSSAEVDKNIVSLEDSSGVTGTLID